MTSSPAHAPTIVSGMLVAALLGVVSDATVPQQSPGQPPVVEPAPIPAARAPRPGEYGAAFDALHYDISLTLPPSGSVISGHTEITVARRPDAPATLPLDLTGLAVAAVRVNGSPAGFSLDSGKLLIALPPNQPSGSPLRVAVDYGGTPDDGLIIRTNVHGHRAVFADNWPNRARFWFPALDHPADKATASFAIAAPAAWEVVANGNRTGPPAPSPAVDGTPMRLTRWSIAEPISPYNMVVGAADLVVRSVGRPCVATGRCVDITTWMFPEDADKAAPSFRRAVDMVEYFSTLIAPFPYGKLAHVQSSTRFGGMENATAIFYAEKPIADGRNIEGTVAHEIAHQWFGDAVTEADWRHVWLSEGLATYLAVLFYEHVGGIAARREMMETARKTVVASKTGNRPVVDPDEQDLFRLLNPNVYEKASWVLHMLRGAIGDEQFFDGLRRYYHAHEHGTALTADLQHAMEQASGTRLDAFFEQWIFHPGFPRFRVSRRWNAATRTATVVVEQTQSTTWPVFHCPLTLELTTRSGKTRRQVEIRQRVERFSFALDSSPSGVVLDPDGWLLKNVE
jgi:aminopeptidase N